MFAVWTLRRGMDDGIGVRGLQNECRYLWIHYNVLRAEPTQQRCTPWLYLIRFQPHGQVTTDATALGSKPNLEWAVFALGDSHDTPHLVQNHDGQRFAGLEVFIG